jgi:penicillin-binding protein 1A
MTKYKYLEQNICDSLQALPIELNYHPLPHYAGIAPYFREQIRQELGVWCELNLKDDGSSYNLYTDGLKIYTTIDSRLQRYAEEAVQTHLSGLQKLLDRQWQNSDLWKEISGEQLFINSDKPYSRELMNDAPRDMTLFTWNGPEEKSYSTIDSLKHYLHFLQAGFLAMDVHTGEIKAWVGGIDHQYFKFDHVKAKRQVGSTIKPLVYLAALENGASPCDYYPNDSVVYSDYDDWTPRNADRSYGGHYSLKGALVNSVNTVSVQVLMETGIDSVVALGKRAGIKSELPAVPSLALGSADISLLEMLGMYQAIANHGRRIEPVKIRRIEDRNGKVLFEHQLEQERLAVFSAENAEIMTEILRNVVDHGTAAGLRHRYNIEADVAGKTGTTQNYTDGWFIGFTPDLVAGVWVGGDLQNVRFRNMAYGQGAYSAMPVWAAFMNSTFGDENFRHLQDSKFEISESTKRKLDCEEYREKKPFEFKPIKKLKEKALFKRLFKRKKK